MCLRRTISILTASVVYALWITWSFFPHLWWSAGEALRFCVCLLDSWLLIINDTAYMEVWSWCCWKRQSGVWDRQCLTNVTRSEGLVSCLRAVHFSGSQLSENSNHVILLWVILLMQCYSRNHIIPAASANVHFVLTLALLLCNFKLSHGGYDYGAWNTWFLAAILCGALKFEL